MNIKYTNNENTEVIAETYQCEYPSIVYFEDVSNECVYITEKDVVNRTSRTFTMNETGFTFLSGYKYFIRITDLNGVELVELTRIYQTGFEPGTRSYGFCESTKCKVPIPGYEEIGSLEVNQALKDETGVSKTLDTDLSEYSDLYFVVKGTAPYGVFLYLNSAPVVMAFNSRNTSPRKMDAATHLTGIRIGVLNQHNFIGKSLTTQGNTNGSMYVSYGDVVVNCTIGTNAILKANNQYGNYGTANVKITLFGKRHDDVVLNAL